MGVEYRNYLLAQDRSFAPALDQVVTLVDRMRAARWVLTPGCPGWVTPSRPHEMTGGWAEPFLERSTSPRERWQRATPLPIPLDAEWLAAHRQPASANPLAGEVALHFYVASGDDGESWKDLGLPYPLAYGEDESGYHDMFIYSSRDFVAGPEGDEVSCECGAALDYEVARGTLAPIDLARRIRAVCEECSKPFAVEDEAGLA